jgi:uncharacterized damage-inducible protein DinB
MEKDIFEAFAAYNKRANNQMNNIIKILTQEEWDKQFSSFWKSIHELCSHIFVGDYGWLSRFKSFVNSKSLSNTYFNKTYEWGKIIFESKDEYFTKREELDDIIINFTNEISNDELNKKILWKDWEEKIIEKKLGIYLMHMFNHETHHRAQVSLYLDMLGKENDFSIFFNRDDQ